MSGVVNVLYKTSRYFPIVTETFLLRALVGELMYQWAYKEDTITVIYWLLKHCMHIRFIYWHALRSIWLYHGGNTWSGWCHKIYSLTSLSHSSSLFIFSFATHLSAFINFVFMHRFHIFWRVIDDMECGSRWYGTMFQLMWNNVPVDMEQPSKW